MTEDEAKTKWCPMVRRVVSTRQEASPGNVLVRTDGTDVRARCIASECMMWRWKQVMINEAEYDRQRNSMMSMTSVKPEYADTEHGYCGLANRP